MYKRQAHIWGTGKRVPLLTAIFVNAMMGHTLELDDVHTDSKTHSGTVVVPAAWSMAEYLGKSGDEFLLAVICGYETMARIGMALGVSAHRNLGWHVTSTAGTFGAAAACAKLLGLDEDQTVSAPVSYTHLDVYKRQGQWCCDLVLFVRLTTI